MRRAVTPDPSGDARGAARAGHQPHRHLGQQEGRVGSGDDLPGEGGQLDPGADAGSVDVRGDPVGEAGEVHPGVAGGAHDVGAGRVVGGAELVEIAPAAEHGPGTAELDAPDARIDGRHLEPGDQLVTHAGAEGVADLGAVERDSEDLVVPPDQHDRPLGSGPARLAGPDREPVPMALAGLQEAVDPRLGDDGVGGGQRLADPQELHEGRGRLRRRRGGRGQLLRARALTPSGQPTHGRAGCGSSHRRMSSPMPAPGGGPSPSATPTITTGAARSSSADACPGDGVGRIVADRHGDERHPVERAESGVVEAVGQSVEGLVGRQDRGHPCTSLPATHVART